MTGRTLSADERFNLAGEAVGSLVGMKIGMKALSALRLQELSAPGTGQRAGKAANGAGAG